VAAHVEALRSEDAAAGVKAAKALTRLGPRALEAQEALLARLADPDKALGRWVATALGALGPAAVPALCQVLSSPDEPAHARAALALQQLGPEAAPAVGLLST
jgi:HEAT repeat protein